MSTCSGLERFLGTRAAYRSRLAAIVHAMHFKRLYARLHKLLLWKPPASVDQPLIVAAIPLIARSRSSDWSKVCRNLAGTVESVLNQTYGDTEIVVCGQDRPDGLPDDVRVRFLKAPNWDLGDKTDKGEKITLMTRDLARRHPQFLYLMILDADDLVHPELFEYVARDNNGTGYLIDKGYMYDASSGALAPLEPGRNGHSFDRHCGSCAVFAVDFSLGWRAVRYVSVLGRGHARYGELSSSFGYPLDSVPFHAAIYTLNHGENARARRGQGGYKLRRLERERITKPDVLRKIRIDFRLTADGQPESAGSAPTK